MKWLIKACLAVVILGVLGYQPVSASGSDATWLGAQPIRVGERITSESFSDEFTCPGDISRVPIGKEYTFHNVCVYGTTTTNRLARYLDASGTYRYAFAFSNSLLFYDLRGICDGFKYCAYSHSEDVLLAVQSVTSSTTGHVMVGSFSSHLVFSTEGYYQYDNQAEAVGVGPGEQLYPSSSVAISHSGHWAVVELWNYGIVRVNLDDLSIRRIGITGVPYGQGSDPRFELAISDSGNLIATAGMSASNGLYVVTESCGDTLGVGATTYFQQGSEGCPMVGLLQTTNFTGLISTHIPRFSGDGQTISLYVITASKRSVSVFSTTPRDVATIGYAAFGDSFTSGQGETSDKYYEEPTNTETNRCHVSTRSYPYLLGIEWGVLAKNYACSGTTSQQARVEFTEKSRTDDIVPMVSLSTGGNDIDLMGKLSTCIALDTCEWASLERRASTAFEIQALLPRLVETITDLKRVYPGAVVFVVGYPSPINSEPAAQCPVSLALLLNREERRYLDESIRLLNSVISTAATITHTRYVTIEDAFIGERLCEGSQGAMNAIRLGDDIAPISAFGSVKIIGSESFHPTPRGHELSAQKITQQLTTGWQQGDCGDCNTSFNTSEYWTDTLSPSEKIVHQVSQTFLNTKDVIAGSVLRYFFPPGTFSPQVPVWFELHSTPVSLARVISEEDGSLQGDLTIPIKTEGYHTVHAYSSLEDATIRDIYETVAISDPVSASWALEFSNAVAAKSPEAMRTSTQGTTEDVYKLTGASFHLSKNYKKEPAAGVSGSVKTRYLAWTLITILGVAALVALAVYWRYRIKRDVPMDVDKGS